MVSFWSYVNSKRRLYAKADQPETDFVDDFLSDREAAMHKHLTSWDRLELYLRYKRACPEAIEIAHKFWRMYVRDGRKAYN